MEKRELVSLVEASIPENSQLVAIIRVGSKAYNLGTVDSDDDYRCIYKQSNKDILSGRYIPNVQVTPDIVAFELREFLRQLHTGSFTATEILFVEQSEDNYVYMYSNIFMELYQRRYQLIGESLVYSMLGYINSHLKKENLTPKQEYHVYRLLYVLEVFEDTGELGFTIKDSKITECLKRIKTGDVRGDLTGFKGRSLDFLNKREHLKEFEETYTKRQIQDLEYEIRVQF